MSAPSFHLHHGDCLEVLRGMVADSIDAIVTDPPYGISFMGARWDYDVPSEEIWRECLRVLKPGGHLLAFFSPRTYHRGAVRIEDAGFELRGQIMWTFGSGFPKNLDVSKAIDKMAGAEREVIGPISRPRGVVDATNALGGNFPVSPQLTAPATEEAQQWDGWGTSLKPSHEPIVWARKPLTGTVAENVLQWGTGAINIDGCRIAHNEECRMMQPQSNPFAGIIRQAGRDRPVLELKPKGRWPASIILQHAPECEQIGWEEEESYTINRWSEGAKPFGGAGGQSLPYESESMGGGQRPVYRCVEGCPVRLMGEQSGESKSKREVKSDKGSIWRKTSAGNGDLDVLGHQDHGTAVRYFLNLEPDPPPFFYSPKPSPRERNAGLEHLPHKSAGEVTGGRKDGSAGLDSPRAGAGRTRGAKNVHPTVKPIALMRYLCRLITPPGGIVLDPFMGSGTTGCAALLEGFGFVGIEREEEFLQIARARIAHWSGHMGNVVPMVGESASPPSQEPPAQGSPAQLSLFGSLPPTH